MVKFNKYFIFLFLLISIIGFKGKIVISFLIAFLHEIVHYLTARYLGFSGFDIEILPIGTVLKLKDLDEATPLEDLIISIAGPLFNLFCAIIFYIIFRYWSSNEYIHILFITNLVLGTFNLIPALPLDGGRILKDVISIKGSIKKANSIVTNISMVEGILFLLYYSILFYSGRAEIININIGLIGLFIVCNSLKERERTVYLTMGDIIKKRFKFLKRRYMENRNVSVYYKESLLFLMNLIDTNRYNIFYILNDDMKIIDIIYESQVVEALKEYGNITVEEYMIIKAKKK